MTSTIFTSINNGVAFIGRNQLPGGGFESLSSVDQHSFDDYLTYKTTFFPSLILAALTDISTDKAFIIKSEIASFLRLQASKKWSFNYWDRSSKEYSQQPYPDDLDDTFCALAALYRYDQSIFSGSVMADIMQLLFATEVKEGGPYNTWLIKQNQKSVWHDIDVMVNANIGYFLSLQGVELPHITHLVEEVILKDSFSSKYYHSPYIFLYGISRWYKGRYRKKLLDMLMNRINQEDDWLNPLTVSMILTSLLRLGYDRKKLHRFVHYLLSTQTKEGSWSACDFYIDPVRNGQLHYAGSSTLTTAFCIEALQLFGDQVKEKQQEKDLSADYFLSSVKDQIAVPRSVSLHKSVNEVANSFFNKKISREVIQLPFVISSAFSVDIPESILKSLAVLNVFGWIAYTIYDDFLDEEGKTWQLPVAHMYSRRLLKSIQQTIPSNIEFQIEAEIILEQIDAANAWEVAHCRYMIRNDALSFSELPQYGDYSTLAYRSMGHAIPAVAIMYMLGATRYSEELQTLRLFFKHYLIARQLNDDAHDWENDLRKGHINTVSSQILALWRESKGDKFEGRVSLVDDIAQLRSLMWEKVIDMTTQAIYKHLRIARSAIDKSYIKNKTPFEDLLMPLEEAAQQTVAEKTKVRDFVNSL